jgi:hypothetical protein
VKEGDKGGDEGHAMETEGGVLSLSLSLSFKAKCRSSYALQQNGGAGVLTAAIAYRVK